MDHQERKGMGRDLFWPFHGELKRPQGGSFQKDFKYFYSFRRLLFLWFPRKGFKDTTHLPLLSSKGEESSWTEASYKTGS